jgi:Rieske Fe-S protein
MKDIYILGTICAGYLLYKYNQEGFVSGIELIKEKKEHIIIKKNGRKHCVSKKCTHQGCLVSIVDKKLVCPCHGARFSLDGKVEKGPYTGEKIKNLPIKDIEDLI